MIKRLAVWFCILALSAFAQTVTLRPAASVQLPTHIDGNSPSFWSPEGFHLFTSTGDPEMISIAPGQFGPFQSQLVDVTHQQHRPIWIEAAWRDDDGTIFGWYHHEPGGVCGSKPLTAPKIGAVVSFDGGRSITDLGIVLETGYSPNCDARNGFFAGGHGDFSVVLDRERKYFYFLFTNYSGPISEQGIVTARLAFEDRNRPAGAVRKFYLGDWQEPGIGGRTTPIFQTQIAWEREDTDSFWGPSVHWNYHISKYVMLLNRACCRPEWPQEGIYVAFHHDLANPTAWGSPQRILSGDDIGYRPGYYPQVMGAGEGGTDTYAGQVARLFVHGRSAWELVFAPHPPVNPEPPGDGEPPSSDDPPPGDDPPPDTLPCFECTVTQDHRTSRHETAAPARTSASAPNKQQAPR